MNIKQYLSEKKALVDIKLEKLLSSFQHNYPSTLFEAIEYSVFAGGKRIRPILTYAACEAFNGNLENALTIGCAIEFIHTYSLIHDDLPAMDNDDYRRGKLTNHKVFGEAVAILAGDALLTDAFNILTNKKFFCSIDEPTLLDIVNFIAQNAGGAGMVGGQIFDLLYENREVNKEIVNKIHINKTAKLITASVYAGARLGTNNANYLNKIINFAMDIGLCFQIIDDILDITGSFEHLGKDINSDIDKNKATYPAVIGIEQSKKIAKELILHAEKEIEFLGKQKHTLCSIANFILERIN